MTMLEYTRVSQLRPQWAVKPGKGGAVHSIHPNHPGVAFCAADVGDPLPEDSPLRRRGWCNRCRTWWHIWHNGAIQDAYWDEEMLRRDGIAPFRDECTEQARAEWRDAYQARARWRAMHPRDAIADWRKRAGLTTEPMPAPEAEPA